MDEEEMRKVMQEEKRRKEELFSGKKESYIRKRESILGISHPKKHFFKFLVILIILGAIIFFAYRYLL